MKQPEDRYTLELAEMPASVGQVQIRRQSEPPKRGRGRPRKDNALSDADRARRYRRNQKEVRNFYRTYEGMSFELAKRIAEKLKAVNAPTWRAAQRFLETHPGRPGAEPSRKIEVCPAPGQSIDFGQLAASTIELTKNADSKNADSDWRYDHDNGTWGYFGYRNP